MHARAWSSLPETCDTVGRSQIEMYERIRQPEEAWTQEHARLEEHGGLQGFTLLTINAMQELPLGRQLIDGIRTGYEAKYIRFPEDDYDEAIVFAAGFVTGYNLLIKQAEAMPGVQIDTRTKVGAFTDVLTLVKNSLARYRESGDSADTPHESLQSLGASGAERFEGLSDFLQKEIGGLKEILLNNHRSGELETVTVGIKEQEIYGVGFSAAASCVYDIRTTAGISNTYQQDLVDARHRTEIERSLDVISSPSGDEFENALNSLLNDEREK